jgi:hypothetical protein
MGSRLPWQEVVGVFVRFRAPASIRFRCGCKLNNETPCWLLRSYANRTYGIYRKVWEVSRGAFSLEGVFTAKSSLETYATNHLKSYLVIRTDSIFSTWKKRLFEKYLWCAASRNTRKNSSFNTSFAIFRHNKTEVFWTDVTSNHKNGFKTKFL